MTRRFLVFLPWVLLLAGCAQKEEPVKRYPMKGEIKALDRSTQTATIDAGKIGDWMDAMTMEYPVKPDAEFYKLHAGDHIEATVVVNGDKYYVTEVNVVQKK